MITFGVDAHKRVHVAIALDDGGREVGQWHGPNTATGWQALLDWAVASGGPRQWGIEGAWNFGRGLAQHLVAAGETVYEVNTRWTAAGRRRARQPGKTDRLDARAVASFVRQEAPELPVVAADDVTAVLDLLASEREMVLNEATRLQNQLHALLLQLDPQYKEHLPTLVSQAGLRALEGYVVSSVGVVDQERAAAVRRLAQRLHLALDQAKELTKQLQSRTKEAGFAPLTEIYGVGLLLAGTLAGVLGPGCRFRTDAQLAAYAGVAPLEASSAGHVRHRLNRGGNRRLNTMLYMIALTQRSRWAPAKEYIARRISEGKTPREALRALKRYLVRAIWRAWKRCLAAKETAAEEAAQAA